MAIIKSCCCWQTVRHGSYACAIYSMVYFSLSCITMGRFIHEERMFLFQNNTTPQSSSILEPGSVSPVSIFSSIIMFCTSFMSLVSSFLLFIGIYRDNRLLLVPWIISMISYTIVDVIYAIYIFIIVKAFKLTPKTAVLFTLDVFILSLHLYALICVISQYQEYTAGRGTEQSNYQDGVSKPKIPIVRYTAPTTATNMTATRKAVTYHETNTRSMGSTPPTLSPTALNYSNGPGTADNVPMLARKDSDNNNLATASKNRNFWIICEKK